MSFPVPNVGFYLSGTTPTERVVEQLSVAVVDSPVAVSAAGSPVEVAVAVPVVVVEVS